MHRAFLETIYVAKAESDYRALVGHERTVMLTMEDALDELAESRSLATRGGRGRREHQDDEMERANREGEAILRAAAAVSQGSGQDRPASSATTPESQRQERPASSRRSGAPLVASPVTQTDLSCVALDELLSLRFLANKEHVIFVGPVGVGKTFPAQALGAGDGRHPRRCSTSR